MGEVKRGADLACGTARATEEAVSSRPGLVMWGFERSRRLVERAVRRAHPRMAVARADTGQLPVATGSLDLVICQNAPVPFPEVARVLRPGGWAILTSVVSFAFPCVLLVRLRCRAAGLEARTVLTTDLGWAVVARRPGAAAAGVEAIVEEASRVAHAESVG
jgi:SAM-dependent methyltransferase